MTLEAAWHIATDGRLEHHAHQHGIYAKASEGLQRAATLSLWRILSAPTRRVTDGPGLATRTGTRYGAHDQHDSYQKTDRLAA
jgi:hypothetical protein